MLQSSYKKHLAAKDALIGQLNERVAKLESMVAGLTSELAQYKTPKNSGNSSLPPSSDFAPPKRNQSLREKSNKAPGGQQGHKGSTLEMRESPDELIEYKPCTCGKCGKDLTDVVAVLVEKRQVVDLPPVVPIYTEHQVYKKTCCCGHVTQGSFPNNVNSPIQYGSSVEAMTVYLHSRQYMSYERMAEYFEHAMNLRVSPGTLNNMVHRFAQ